MSDPLLLEGLDSGIIEEQVSVNRGRKEKESTKLNAQVAAQREERLSKKKEPRQIKDDKLIEQRISELPAGIRRIMEEKFRGDFVSIEKIDKKKLL